MTFRQFKYLPGRAASDKLLCNKVFHIAKNPKYDGYQRGVTSVVYKSFRKNCLVGVLHVHGQRFELSKINILLKVKIHQTNNYQNKNYESQLWGSF